MCVCVYMCTHVCVRICLGVYIHLYTTGNTTKYVDSGGDVGATCEKLTVEELLTETMKPSKAFTR